MKSTASIKNHPIHPMLIPYPFAFLSGAAAFDAAALARADDGLARTAAHMRAAGIVTALAAAVPGLIDYLTTVPSGRPRQMATVHMVSNLSALACFGAAAASRQPGRRMLGWELAGTVLLSVGGWLGGHLSYHYQVGVVPEETAAETPAFERAAEQHQLR